VNDNNVFENSSGSDSLKIEGLNYVFNYRYPNFGKYLTYYITDFGREDNYTNDCNSPFSEANFGYSSLNFCGKYGIIVLLDTTKKIGHYIPILLYDSGSEVFNMNFRFFYITKNKEILIYEGESIRQKNAETDEFIDKFKVTLNKTHIISVDSNNEIVIKNPALARICNPCLIENNIKPGKLRALLFKGFLALQT
jgi:hypothetical protein